MRYLVLSDIHSNLEALTVVLKRVRRKRFDRIVILGDLVGYGADPNPIVDRVRKLKRSVIIRGNHDCVAASITATCSTKSRSSRRAGQRISCSHATASGSARSPKAPLQ